MTFSEDEVALMDLTASQLYSVVDMDLLAWLPAVWKGERVLVGGEFVGDDKFSPMIIAVTQEIADQLKPPPDIIENDT